MGMISASVGLCYFTAVNYIPVSTAAMVFYTFPLVILILTPFIDKTPVSPVIWGLAAFAFLGLALVIGGDFKALDWRGIIAALAASITAATQFFMAKRITKRFSPVALVFYIHCIILPIVFILTTFQGGVKPPGVLFNAFLPVLIVALGYVFGFVLQMEASRNAPPALIGLIFCFEPVVALTSAAFIFHESLTLTQIIGAVCVLTALITASIISLKQAKA
jgi:drug/metabolite transporter (DMT)-like permease